MIIPLLVKKVFLRLIDYGINIPFYPRTVSVLAKSMKAPHIKKGLLELKHMKRQSLNSDGSKYLHYPSIWLIDNALRLVRLSLDRKPPCRILDLGAGAGYFIAMARAFGHCTMGIDLGEHKIYTPINKAFGNLIIWHRITPVSPLPSMELQEPFDIITAFSITFDRYGRGPDALPWTLTDWKHFLSNLAPFLRPRGLISLQLNTKTFLGCLGREFEVFRTKIPQEAGFECISIRQRSVKLRLAGPKV